MDRLELSAGREGAPRRRLYLRHLGIAGFNDLNQHGVRLPPPFRGAFSGAQQPSPIRGLSDVSAYVLSDLIL